MAVDYDGGPAFPLQLSDEHGTFHCGMSLRDYFAGQVIAGLMANPERYHYISAKVAAGMSHDEASAKSARKAYLMADAMLKAREA